MGEERRNDLGKLRLLDAATVEGLRWEPLEGRAGVFQKVLWKAGSTVLGLMRLDPDVTDPAHTHLGAHHHIWVVSGTGRVCGRTLTTGSYAYIPPGTEHETVAGPDGFTFFYTYRPLDTEHDHGEEEQHGAFV